MPILWFRHPFSLRLAAALSLLLLPCLSLIARAQPVRLDGTFSLSSELYSSSGIDPRLPRGAVRAVLSPTITIFDQIRLPFEIYWTNDDRGFRQPFNQFGVSPTLWGWLTLHAGYFSSRLSDLTFGDSRLLGGGVEARPGNFHLAFLYGTSQRSAEPDSASGFAGSFRRRVIAARIGYGQEEEAYIGVNFLHAEDDSTSLLAPPAGLVPQENAVLSLRYGIPLFGSLLRFQGETALSAHSNDTHIAEHSDVPTIVRSLFTPRFSTQVDGATQLSLTIIPSAAFSLRLQGKMIGPGFVTLGYVQLPSDVLEATVAPSVRLLQGALLVRGSLGLRQNNLRGNRLATTQRTIGNLSVSVQPSPAVGIDAQYANYGMRSNPRNDTLRIDNISQMVMLSPRYTFEALGGNNTITASYTFQDFSDYNIVTGRTGDNRSQSVVAAWSLAKPSSLSLTTVLMYVFNTASGFSTKVQGMNETVGHSFFDGALSAQLTVGYTVVGGSADDAQVNLRVGASYALGPGGTLILAVMNNRYDTGGGGAGRAFTETTGSLQYLLSF